ncbi:MAG: autotransporter domain-containing protein [Pseudomonadota bacterium]
MKRIWTCAISACALAAAAPAAAQDYNSAAFFGDSLSDPGNIPITSGVNFPAPPYVGNRFSNGPVYAEFVPGILGIEAANVFNSSHGGAFTGQLDIGGGTLSGNLNPFGPIAQTDILSQVDDYLAANGGASPDALYTILAGANDYFLVLGGLATSTDPQGDILASTQNATANLATASERLIANGAQTVVIINLPDLGSTAQFAADPDASAAATALTTLHNTALAQDAARISNTTGADVVFVDILTLTNDMQATPSKYGLVNTTDQCILTPSCVNGSVETQNTFQFWDGVHPTSGVHEIAAAFYADTLTSPFTIAPQIESVRFMADARLRRMANFDAMAHADENGAIVFADAGYVDIDRDGEGATAGYELTSYDVALGAGRAFGDAGWLLGYLGYGDGESDLTSLSGSFDIETFYVGGSAGVAAPNGVVFSVHALYGVTDVEAQRTTGVVGQTASGGDDGTTFNLLAEVSTTKPLIDGDIGLSIKPILRAGFAQASLGAYAETGATGLDLFVAKRSADAFYGEIGARLDLTAGLGETGVIKPYVAAFYREAFEDFEQEISTAIVTADQVRRTLTSDALDDSGARIEGGLALDMGGLTLDLSAATHLSRDDFDGVEANLSATFAF